MSKNSIKDFILLPEKNLYIFNTEITPEQLDHCQPRKAPRGISLIGQPGSSKSTISRKISKKLKGGCVVLDFDRLMLYHPDYPLILELDHRDVQLYVKHDVKIWIAALEKGALKRNCNIIWKLSGADSDIFLKISQTCQEYNYYRECTVLGVSPAISKLGIEYRYWQGMKNGGFGRYIPDNYHIRTCDGLLEICQMLGENPALAEALTVLAWGGSKLQKNDVTPEGHWYKPVLCQTAAQKGRNAILKPSQLRSVKKMLKFLEKTEIDPGVFGEIKSFLQTITLTNSDTGNTSRSVTPRRLESTPITPKNLKK